MHVDSSKRGWESPYIIDNEKKPDYMYDILTIFPQERSEILEKEIIHVYKEKQKSE